MTTIDSYFLSDVGLKRTNNEDAAGAFEPKDSRQLKQSGCLYIVADGLGGHQLGEKASNYAVETLLKVYYDAPKIPPEKRLRDIILQINQNLVAFAHKNMAEGEKTATTVVTAVVRNNNLLVANVGDSRAYLIRDGKIRQITNDHSFVGELVRAGTITEVEAQESKFKNRLSRSVGSDAKLEVELYPLIPLHPADIILLCTDGLTQYATAQNLLEAASVGKAREIVERLIRFAKAHGGSDNITASVIKIGKKSTWVQSKTAKIITAVLLGMLMLTVVAMSGWYMFASPTALFKKTATPTASPTLTATLTPTITPTISPTATPTETAALTVEASQTSSPVPSETNTPEPSIIPTINPPPYCEYTIKSGDHITKIIETFQTTIEQIVRSDGTQGNLDLIFPGEILFIKNIPNNVCINGGGTVQSQSPATP